VDFQGTDDDAKQIQHSLSEGLDNLLAENNFLMRLLLFLEYKLLTCNRNCLICDKKLEHSGMKPAVCSREVCIMGYEEFGLGFDLGTEIVQQPQVVDLLISFMVSAVNSNRLLFVTPSGVVGKDAKSGKEFTFAKSGCEGKKELSQEDLDVSRLTSCLQQCPPVADMAKMVAKNTLKEDLQKIDPLLYPLLRWILTSNRAHIRPLTEKERIPELKTQYQFVLLSSNPDREAKFQNFKRVAAGMNRFFPERGLPPGPGGSCFAYHGSSTGNWHSILRTGLKNMSGTAYMTTGAAYGPGIYMAKDSSTSFGYCRDVGGWSKSMYGQLICLSVCEVVKQRCLNEKVYYVVPNEDTVTTRFLCVYPQSFTDRPNVAVSSLTTPHIQ